MKKLFITVIICICSMQIITAQQDPPAATSTYPGETFDFFGYDARAFNFAGRPAKLAFPKQAAPGNPWIWRALFWGHEPQTDTVLLSKGYHVAYVEVADLHGSPAAVEVWEQYYQYLTTTFSLSSKTVLECFSRAGLIGYNWAAQHPAQVACIYADAPVLDIKSWPGRKGPISSKNDKGENKKLWEQCLQAYDLTEEEALTFKGNPLDNLKALAAQRVPLLHVCGMADEAVPYEENTGVLVKKYRALGGTVEEIKKPGVGHHPHSLTDPAPIVEFILRNNRE